MLIWQALESNMFRVLTLTIFIGLVCGCSETLETGYKPTPLGASAAVRRSYYASPFTPEAKGPQMERDQEFEARRPRPGY
jgi:hypothetical protein